MHSKAMGLMGDVDAKIDERKHSSRRASSEPVILSQTGAGDSLEHAHREGAEVCTCTSSCMKDQGVRPQTLPGSARAVCPCILIQA